MKKTLIALVAALALLGIVLLKTQRDQKALVSDAPAMDSTRKTDLKTIRFAKRPDTSTLDFKDGKWLVSKDGFPVDTGKINRTVGNLFGLQTRELVSKSPARLAEYGLDSVEAKHVVMLDKAGKALAEIVLGKTSGADYSSTYWKWEGKPEVYRTPGNFSWEVGVKEEEWKDRKLFGFSSKEIKQIETIWKDSTGKSFAYKLEAKDDSTWRMVDPPDSNRVIRASVTEMTTRLSEMSIDDFVKAADSNVSNADLANPMIVVKYIQKDGRRGEIKAGRTLDTYAYTQHPTRPDLVKLSAWRFDPFKKKPFELLEVRPHATDSSAVSKPGNKSSAKN